jgi:hypothetical protein
LMCTTYQINIVRLIKLGNNIATEQIASTAWTDAPAEGFFGIGPAMIHSDDGRDFVKRLCLTTTNHTSDHREVLPSFGQSVGFDQEY